MPTKLSKLYAKVTCKRCKAVDSLVCDVDAYFEALPYDPNSTDHFEFDWNNMIHFQTKAVWCRECGNNYH